MTLQDNSIEPKGTPPFRLPAPLSDGVLHVCNQEYTSFILTPLLIDFSAPSSFPPSVYYNRTPQKLVERQIADVMRAIKNYREKRPNGILRVYPFVGINPSRYTSDSLLAFLTTCFSNYTKTEHEFEQRFFEFPDKAQSFFAGIKLYPPIGFDPWPDDPKERQKVTLLYQFAEERGIPITTHCDDQGYRIIPLEDALKFTSPSRYRPVLAQFPQLVLNFAIWVSAIFAR